MIFLFEYKWGKFGDSVFEDAYTLREKVFIGEQHFCEEADEHDKNANHLVIYKDGQAIASGRCFYDNADDSDIVRVGRVCVDKDYRGNDFGKLLMQEIEIFCKKRNAKYLVLGSQEQAEGFYQKLGYVPHGEYYYEEHCRHIPMIKKI